MQAIEARIASYLQRGAAVEAEVLTVLTGLLPDDVQQQLPGELKDILLRGTANKRVPPTPPTYEEAQSVPLASVAKSQTGESEPERVSAQDPCMVSAQHLRRRLAWRHEITVPTLKISLHAAQYMKLCSG